MTNAKGVEGAGVALQSESFPSASGGKAKQSSAIFSSVWERSIPTNSVHYAKVGDGSNYEMKRYFELLGTLSELKSLDEDDDLYVPPEIVERATKALSDLEHRCMFTLPKLIPEDGESLSMTWLKGFYKIFLSVYSDETSVLVIDQRSHISCRAVVGTGQDLGISELTDCLGFRPRASSGARA